MGRGLKEHALEMIEVSKAYHIKSGPVRALDNVSIHLPSGGLYGLMGPSGSGKTTLLKVSAGLLKPEQGSVRLFGIDIYGASGGRNRKIGKTLAAFMFQEDLLIQTLTLRENVELPLIIIGGTPKRARERIVSERLDEVGIGDLADRKPWEVSGGERRRVSLARCLVHQPRILFLDEPTSNLDSKTAAAMIDLIKGINREGATIFISTHDHFVADQIEHIHYMRDGRITQAKGPHAIDQPYPGKDMIRLHGRSR